MLIPVYNYDISKLVYALDQQANVLGIQYEINCYDDCSSSKFNNATLSEYDKVNYKELPANLGRAKIRNLMASEAQYDLLLFLDCDSKIISSNFLSTYLKEANGLAVISGGRNYSALRPENDAQMLHWIYGTKKESRSLNERIAEPVKYFHSNNFLAPKSLFDTTQFREDIDGYGYEDLVFGQQIQAAGLELRHINNPVEHMGLEMNEVFIEKTEKALLNLLELQAKGVKVKTNLTELAHKLKSFGLTGLYKKLFRHRLKKMRTDLIHKKTSLKKLDAYKLAFYFLHKESQS